MDPEDVEKLLSKAKEPGRLAMGYHPFYRGKISITAKAPIKTLDDFSIWYTPGVAEPCKAIKEDEDRVYEYTNKGNFVAVVSDGTRVLGLGDIGPRAGMPVMEGKSMIFKYLGGVDAFPICLDTKKEEEIITAVKWLSPSFGGINLEDIEKPKCYSILERLRNELDIPVWHDDQQGTALVTLAGLLGALKVVGKKIGDVTIAFIGAGAANANNSKYSIKAGADPKKMIMVDSKGILNQNREDLKDDPVKWDMCINRNGEQREGGIEEALEGVDVCIALSRSGPGVIKKEWVSAMASGSIVFACANPVPEIWPWEAEEAGARIISTGRSDFPNQVNNSLGFPAVFRGALDVFSRGISDEMCISGAMAIADYAERTGLSEKRIIPSMEEGEMYIEEAMAVGLKSMEQGLARLKLSEEELRDRIEHTITEAQRGVKLLMDAGIIAEYKDKKR
jgi:malate dehydrogenase (oxaloacetate-decarboxylating)